MRTYECFCIKCENFTVKTIEYQQREITDKHQVLLSTKLSNEEQNYWGKRKPEIKTETTFKISGPTEEDTKKVKYDT